MKSKKQISEKKLNKKKEYELKWKEIESNYYETTGEVWALVNSKQLRYQSYSSKNC